jgi:hypothetical protein
MFKVFHYGQQYDEYKHLEITESQISEQYLGIVMQSNWDAPYYGAPLKY